MATMGCGVAAEEVAEELKARRTEALQQRQAEADAAMAELLAEEEGSKQQNRKGEKQVGGKKGKAKRQVRVSKAMSYLLRHGAKKEGLVLRPDGYAKVSEVLQHKSLKGASEAELQEIVTTNDKKRFALMTDAGGVLWVRANQGHTIRAVQDAELLTELTDAASVPVCIHGTYHACIGAIMQRGLSRMTRNHVHFAAGLPDDPGGVISGMRGNCEVAVYVDVAKAMAPPHGLKFYRSANDVILCPGDGDGFVSSQCFCKVVDLNTGTELVLPSLPLQQQVLPGREPEPEPEHQPQSSPATAVTAPPDLALLTALAPELAGMMAQVSAIAAAGDDDAARNKEYDALAAMLAAATSGETPNR